MAAELKEPEEKSADRASAATTIFELKAEINPLKRLGNKQTDIAENMQETDE